MKKKNLKNLNVNKRIVSKFKVEEIKGGVDKTNPWVCTGQCTVNLRYCGGETATC